MVEFREKVLWKSNASMLIEKNLEFLEKIKNLYR